MKETENRDSAMGTLNRPTRHASPAKQPLVVRQGESDFEREVLERLARLEENQQAAATAKTPERRATRFDLKTIVAAAAIVLSLAGYVIQDARNSSRQDTDIETLKVRLSNLERIATTNTEARIRTEVQLGELREGQVEIKRMIEAHDAASRSRPR